MKFFAKENRHFFKNNFQLMYAVVLLILIPAALIINTVIFINNTQKVIDAELQKKASLATGILSASLPDLLSDPAALQKRIVLLAQSNEELRSIDVLVPDGENFKITASLDPQAAGTISKFVYNTIAWKTDESVAYQTNSSALSTEDQSQRSDQRFWIVAAPVKSQAGTKVAILTTKISSKVIDDLSRDNLNRSIIVLVVTVLIIVLLLANNTRMFQYAVLFKKLKEVDQMKDEFISMTSHELRAPIVGIRGYLQMILDKSFGELPKEAEEKLKLVLRESNRLHELVEDLLDVSRIEQGRVTLELKPINLLLLFEEVVGTFKKIASDKGLQLITDVKVNVPPVHADLAKFKQIIVNLTSNAVKYTPKGSVTLSAEVKEEMVKIKISDTGMGMSAKDREHLFEKFYRVRNEKTDSISGTGLGLWITRELVRLMKGEIYIDSMENVGTQVSIVLPAYKEKK
jgi:signal transduction histidine kinase